MKEEFLNLFEGQRIVARVEDSLSSVDLIVGFQGHLLRVKNTSEQIFNKGDLLDLVVIRSHPLEFQLYTKYKKQFDRFA